MAKQELGIPKGTRDFLPLEMARRNYIFDTIKNVFKSFGYQPIETPAMENLSTLLGKYGDEGDKLLFRVLNSGDFMSKVPGHEANASQQLLPYISEKGLRYDLTVPFARFVVQNRNSIQLPFKRYQVQPVWRADRPQKGRYREFYQCDADVIGSNSLLNEAELIKIIDEVFISLGIRVAIKLNNRKILAGIAETIGLPDRITDITVAMDKLEKIGSENVKKELQGKGIADKAVEMLMDIIGIAGKGHELLHTLEGKIQNSSTGMKGIGELKTIYGLLETLQIQNLVETDLSLARGLNYYTGAIIEVKALDVEIGSICGGGRYDDLTGIFGMPGLSGVGISFGADRIFDVINSMDNYPAGVLSTARVMFVNFGPKETLYCLPLISGLHKQGISAFIYPDEAKIKKQLAYAGDLKIPFVVMAGEDEINQAQVTLRNMADGTQEKIDKSRIYGYVKG